MVTEDQFNGIATWINSEGKYTHLAADFEGGRIKRIFVDGIIVYGEKFYTDKLREDNRKRYQKVFYKPRKNFFPIEIC